MDDDRRDPRDWPSTDGPEGSQDGPGHPSGDPPAEPAWNPSASEGGQEARWGTADAGGWPAEDASEPSSDTPAAVDPGETRPWPTEPPSAGSGAADTWPTSAPERSADESWSTRPDEPAPAPDAGLGQPEVEGRWDENRTDAGTAPEADVPSEPTGDGATTPEPAWSGDPRPEPTDEGGVTQETGAWEDRAEDRAPVEAEAYPSAPATTPAPQDTGMGAGAAAGMGAGVAAGAAAHGVPDAQGAIGESTKCPRCGTENRPGLAFCRNCGQRLVAAGVATTVERPGAPEGTQACPRCGTHNRSGVAFCQNCGANLRGTAPGYVPPAVSEHEGAATVTKERTGAVLGPVVLLIGMVGLITGYLLPFLSDASLYSRALGSGGYGVAFWNGYPELEPGIADAAYYGLAAPVPLFAILLAALAVAGFLRARPGGLQTVGLIVALVWSVGLIVLFLLVELAGNWAGDLVGLLRLLTPAGIILFLASLIVLIGVLTRFGRS